MLLLAHRGASAAAPENTLTAFREAVVQGADGVELDVRVCGSGELVVCHDPTLDRLAGLPWEVARTPWWKLRQADVGTRLGFAPERIPRLEEVFDALPAPLWVNVELKGEGLDGGGLAAKVARYLTSARLEGRVVVSSFNPFLLLRLAAACGSLRRGFLLNPEASFALHGGLIAPLVSSYSIHPHHSACTSPRVARWHRWGLVVAAWTVDDPKRALALRQMGVDLLITNRPGELRRALAEA
ncbi:MAG: glycerophosphodiester phosphodiesterase [Myxococcaceae bacterium]